MGSWERASLGRGGEAGCQERPNAGVWVQALRAHLTETFFLEWEWALLSISETSPLGGRVRQHGTI